MNTYTAEQPDKEQEVIPTVTSIAVPNPEGDKLTSLDHVDVQLDTKSRGICVCFCLKAAGFYGGLYFSAHVAQCMSILHLE